MITTCLFGGKERREKIAIDPTLHKIKMKLTFLADAQEVEQCGEKDDGGDNEVEEHRSSAE